MPQSVKKVVIPAAGLGTRFLPMTKVFPKELLPIVDKPALQYVIEEAVDSGIDEIILVISKGKETIAEYFTHNKEYEAKLKELGKEKLLDELNDFIKRFKITLAYQDEPKGLGHATYCAKDAVGDEPFILILPDVIIESDPPCSKQLIDVYNRIGKSVIYTEHTPRDQLHLYGVLDLESSVGPLHKIRQMIEKPSADEAPSDLTIVGRYLFTSSIFPLIEQTKPGKGGEIQITDAMTELAKTEGLYAFEHEAKVFDTGDKLGYMRANVHYGVRNSDFGENLKKEIMPHS